MCWQQTLDFVSQAEITHHSAGEKNEWSVQQLPLIKMQILCHHKELLWGEQSIVGAINVSLLKGKTKRAGDWKFSCVLTAVVCAPVWACCLYMRVHVCLRGLLFLMNRLDLLLSYHNPFSKPGPPWFLLSREMRYCDLHNKKKEGPTSSGCIAISPFNDKCPIQPPSTTPKHTHTLPPQKTSSNLYKPPPHTT